MTECNARVRTAYLKQRHLPLGLLFLLFLLLLLLLLLLLCLR